MVVDKRAIFFINEKEKNVDVREEGEEIVRYNVEKVHCESEGGRKSGRDIERGGSEWRVNGFENEGCHTLLKHPLGKMRLLSFYSHKAIIRKTISLLC